MQSVAAMCCLVLNFEARVNDALRRINSEVEKANSVQYEDALKANAFALLAKNPKRLSVLNLTEKQIHRFRCNFEQKVKDRDRMSIERWKIFNNLSSPVGFSMLISEISEENVRLANNSPRLSIIGT